MDYANDGEKLLADANEWIDASRALSAEEVSKRFSYVLSDDQKIRLRHLIEVYTRLPSQLYFFHGYLHHIVGESLFRDFVRLANSLSGPTRAEARF